MYNRSYIGGYPLGVATGVKGIYHSMWELWVGKKWSQISHRKLEISISHSVVISVSNIVEFSGAGY